MCFRRLVCVFSEGMCRFSKRRVWVFQRTYVDSSNEDRTKHEIETKKNHNLECRVSVSLKPYKKLSLFLLPLIMVNVVLSNATSLTNKPLQQH